LALITFFKFFFVVALPVLSVAAADKNRYKRNMPVPPVKFVLSLSPEEFDKMYPTIMKMATESGITVIHASESTAPPTTSSVSDAIDEKDIELVMEGAKEVKCTRKTAILALYMSHGDIVQAIVSLLPPIVPADNPQQDTTDTPSVTQPASSSSISPPVSDSMNEKDIELVMQGSNCTREQATVALEKSRGDIVNAIMDLT
jgi:NACalpha-BTF3-like transcription factor